MAVEPTSRPDASTVASQINKHIDEMKTNSALENNNSSSGQKANGGTSSTKVVVDQVDIVAFERGDTNVPL